MSSLWIGRRQAVGIGVEATRGTAIGPTYWLSTLSFTFSDKPTRALSEASFGGIWGGDQAPVVLTHAEGEFDVELGDQSIGAILYALFGTVSSVANGDGSYTHTYTLANNNQHKSLTITTTEPIGQLYYAMSMIDTFELVIEPDSIMHYTVNFISKSSGDSGGQVASYGAEKKFVGRNLTFKVAATTADLDAASKSNLKSLTFRVEKNAEATQVLATIQPEDIVNKRFNITGEITLNYEDRTFLNLVKNGTNRAVRIDIVHDDDAGVGNNYQLRFDLSKCSFENFDPDFTLDEVVTQTITFNAMYDAGGNDNVINSVYLINAVASY